jgi:hypothetical protein
LQTLIQFFYRIIIFMLCIGVVQLGWYVAHHKHYKSGVGLGYNLGLVGGLMVLTLLLYSFRKHTKFMQRVGKLKYWFRIHMILGVLGPIFILFHTTFQLGSLNASIALYCMLLVAGSGLIGRFVYRRIHQGLYGSRLSLKEARAVLAGNTDDVKAKLHGVPEISAWVDAFEHEALEKPHGFLTGIWHFLTFDVRRILLVWRCKRRIRQFYAVEKTEDLTQETVKFIKLYLIQIQTVAQFKKFEQIFSAWHILHIPLMYMMLATAIFHVIWVHMY